MKTRNLKLFQPVLSFSLILSLVLILNFSFFSFGQGPGFDPCDTQNGGPGCSGGPSVAVFFGDAPDSTGVDQPTHIVVVAFDANQKVDTTNNDNVSLSKFSGPGSITGNLSAPFSKGVAQFDVAFDAHGGYELIAASGALIPDTSNVIFADSSKKQDPGGPGGPGGPGDFDPCDTLNGGPGCSDGPAAGVTFADLPDSVGVNQQFPVNVLAMDTTGKVDTTYNANVTLVKVSGPGSVTGNLSVAFTGGVAEFMIEVDVHGPYTFEITSGNLKADTSDIVYADSNMQQNPGGPGGPGFDPCDTLNGGPGCSDGPAVKAVLADVPDTMGVKSKSKIMVAALGNDGKVDTTATGNVTVNKISGTGNLSGMLSGSFNRGVVELEIEFDAHGLYEIGSTSSGLISDTAAIYADSNFVGGPGPGPGPDPGGDPMCNPATESDRENLGLYGGSSLDLTFTNSGRLFAAIETPASLFVSDDTAKTWRRAFPNDSLEYSCGTRGWGGRSMKVLTNNTGWVLAYTTQNAGTLTSAAISFSEGDSGTWKTAMDGYMLNQLGENQRANTGIGLSDYWAYILNEHYISILNDSSLKEIIDVKADLSFPQGTKMGSLAPANNPTGYPFYAGIDTTGDFNAGNASLYKYDGTNWTNINIPGLKSVAVVFTHPAGATGDTVFVSGKDINGKGMVFRSFDGGSNWTDISPAGGGNMGYTLNDVDYSPDWTHTGKLALCMSGIGVSYDMGDTWQTFQLQNNGNAVHPADTGILMGTQGRGVVLSKNGSAGPFEPRDNYGLEAVKISQIAKSKGKTIFYIATSAGLAYTTAYQDTSVAGFDKWNAPNGEFPVVGVGDDAGISSVAINPEDSNHVIAGYSNGFSVTKTGPAGFQTVNPATWQNTPQKNPRVEDVVFVSTSIVVAVTGGDNETGAGNIWRSTDGGDNWTTVTPNGYANGHALTVGRANGDTVIYCGAGLSNGGSGDPGALWKSTDKGVTWTKVNDGPNSAHGQAQNMTIFDVAVDPRDNDLVYIAAGDNLDHAFAYSTDGGVTYAYTDIFGEGAFTSISINEDNPDTVYTAIRRDIYLYDKVNDSSELVFRGLPGELVPDLIYGSILAGTNTGFFKISEEDADTSDLPTVVLPIAPDKEAVAIYPNPLTNQAQIEFTLERTSRVSITLFDLLGKQVAVVADELKNEGVHKIDLDASDLSKGTYFLHFRLSNRVVTKKIIIMK